MFTFSVNSIDASKSTSFSFSVSFSICDSCSDAVLAFNCHNKEFENYKKFNNKINTKKIIIQINRFFCFQISKFLETFPYLLLLFLFYSFIIHVSTLHSSIYLIYIYSIYLFNLYLSLSLVHIDLYLAILSLFYLFNRLCVQLSQSLYLLVSTF